ncbi:hypothetical protein BAMA_19845 [Bacillus manliponensis]|uniref:DUF3952 domain-containing protein n=1 Tax=Bacillus manliponensis TaxID=574376 RepID=A0A073K0Q2_9BACI|nr:DUF3952 domain-containing protein [Bacillus manliponensis]KEK20012.1 hypothetical protein BAMA_19845 [Bacillus manliponensis]
MKQKLMIKLTAVVTTVATLLGGCGIVGETKIAYEPFEKALDEGDMAKVMSAGEDGYAHVGEQVIFSTREAKEDGKHIKTIYQTTNGVYNSTEKKLYGSTTQKIATKIKSKEDPTSVENYKSEHIYDADIMYADGKVTSVNPDVDISHVSFLLDQLQGIGKLTPDEDTQGGSEPNSVGYDLTEERFQELINNKLNINYDEFEDGSIVLDFNSTKGSSTLPMALLEIGIVVRFKKKNDEGSLVNHSLQIYYSFNDKKGNEKAKAVYMDYENKYKNK